ncbi:Zinc transporter ZupT [Roseimaritima multifibrata]|uniref:Zinc transporter ZupT n=1 Tax=Roseimaritima multifibrata TaxID=1930274 RepID=A0A517M9Y7_9BACT|nr:ZIP family metal transporter [Roseimaritima multifibrata]QDS91702.1 Zinc transporter ZupT [Roseimaritima multifibrata]
MTTLGWIIVSGVAMSVLSLVGGLTLILKKSTLERVMLPLVAFAAGALIGGALFHMIPNAIDEIGNTTSVYVWIAAGFILFLAVEQFLNWHHSHSPDAADRQPLTYLILLGDGLHNFVGGLFVGASFLVDVRLGITAWLAAAAHEIPQELGDFGVLLHGGWSKSGALTYNFFSASTFLLGGVIAYFASGTIDVSYLVPFAAGNFLYIGAADLIPEIKKTSKVSTNAEHFLAFSVGLGVLLLLRLFLTT